MSPLQNPPKEKFTGSLYKCLCDASKYIRASKKKGILPANVNYCLGWLFKQKCKRCMQLYCKPIKKMKFY